MTNYSLVICDKSTYTKMHIVIYNLCFAPLLKLHYDDIVFILGISANDNEVYSF